MLRLDLNVTVDRVKLLERLKANRETHAQVVAEARTGYLREAERRIKTRLSELQSGKMVALVFRLQVPVDRTDVYDTAIGMLEMHTAETIDLEAQNYRELVEDKWDWSGEFWGTNKMYSASATKMAEERGY